MYYTVFFQIMFDLEVCPSDLVIQKKRVLASPNAIHSTIYGLLNKICFFPQLVKL